MMRGGPGHFGRDLPEGKPTDSGAVLRRFWSYLRPYWRHLLVALLLMLFTAATGALGPYLIGLAIDHYIAAGVRNGLETIILVLFGTYLAGFVARVAQGYLTGWVAQRALAGLRVSIFQSLQRQSLTFFDRHEAGDLMSRLVNDVEVINQILGQGLVQSIGSLFGLLGIVLAMLALDLRLAAASFVVLPVMFLTTNFFSSWARRSFRTTRQTIGDVSANLQEDIAGIKVAQAFNRTQFNRARFAERNAANRDANVGATAVTSAFFPAMDVLSAIATGIVAGFGGYLAINGQATVGVVVAFLGYVQQFFFPIQQVAQMWAQAQSAMAGAERIFDLVDTPVDLQDAADARELPAISGRVTFEDVHFSYEPGHPVLDGINFTAEPGKTVALVGQTGAGKTTTANLIARFYDVTSGRVLVDGTDVRTVTSASLRRQMGIVPQNSFLFAGTVADNIRYGRLEASDAEVEMAAKTVNAHDFIMSLPQGYRTHLGERGGGLSQGQRQLIAFARAVLADPRILILDEATSSVDTRTEVLIQQALARLLEKRTAFVIAHRLSTVRNADQVLVLDGGRVVEHGTHRELLAKGGAYSDLYRRQFRDSAPAQAVPATDGSPAGDGRLRPAFGRP
ncbi:MAG: ABC transporter ATP-binding protein/permease [Chloroflexi bacterium]|nr:ABC transporter ATP-binding protein/permease [Chloroflexota bacterium]